MSSGDEDIVSTLGDGSMRKYVDNKNHWGRGHERLQRSNH